MGGGRTAVTEPRPRRALSIRQLLAALLVVVLILSALLSIVTVLQVRTATDRTDAERQRVTSFRLSDQMRQSSNDLTRMVRLYVTTGDPRYREYYDEILEIRSGDAPRPKVYDSSFWDHVSPTRTRRSPPARRRRWSSSCAARSSPRRSSPP